MQNFTSAKTSINKNKLPASTKKINWELYRGKKVLDVGGGKFDNLKDFLKLNFEIDLFIYDKFNRTNTENEMALTCQPDLIISNNVLNVIDSIDIIKSIISTIEGYQKPFYISVYEGNKTNIGNATNKDCYQRNERTKEYLKYFNNAVLKNNLIIG
jgi:ABC-type Fe3+-hydroxamate transport system substrate-binding protein